MLIPVQCGPVPTSVGRTLNPSCVLLFLFSDSQIVLQNVDKAQFRLTSKKDNVAGVTLPIFQTSVEGTDSMSH